MCQCQPPPLLLQFKTLISQNGFYSSDGWSFAFFTITKLVLHLLAKVFHNVMLLLSMISNKLRFHTTLFILPFNVTSLLFCNGHSFGLYALLLSPLKKWQREFRRNTFSILSFSTLFTIMDGWILAFSNVLHHVLRFEFVLDLPIFHQYFTKLAHHLRANVFHPIKLNLHRAHVFHPSAAAATVH